MKRLILQGSRFLVVSLAIYLAAFWAMTKTEFLGKPFIYRTSDYYQWKGGAAWMQYTELDPSAHWDALVIGSSHAYRGYDPRVFSAQGYHMFNLGSSAQTPLNGYYVLKQHADSAHVGLVIYDLYENAFDQDGLESTSELTQHVRSESEAWGMAWGLRDLRGLNLMALRHFTRNDGPMFTDTTYKGAGFAIQTAPARKDVKYDVGRKWRLNAKQAEYFIKSLDLCAERGVRVVLSTHCYPQRSDHVRHAAFAAFVDSVIATRDAKEGLRWLDFAYDHDLDDHAHFCDHTHLNEAGARIFNERLVDSLVAKGYLPRR